MGEHDEIITLAMVRPLFCKRCGRKLLNRGPNCWAQRFTEAMRSYWSLRSAYCNARSLLGSTDRISCQYKYIRTSSFLLRDASDVVWGDEANSLPVDKIRSQRGEDGSWRWFNKRSSLRVARGNRLKCVRFYALSTTLKTWTPLSTNLFRFATSNDVFQL